MKRLLFFFLLACFSSASAQDFQTPLQENNYTRPTSYDELTSFVQQLDANSGLLTVEIAGKSIQGRNIYAMKFSSSAFGTDPSKIRVLIFAQQHGNEPSGKEGALLLARELIRPDNRYLFNRIDLLLIPQMNPDGSETNSRRNGNDADLNRNHLILTEPEVIALHLLFDQYLFEITMDVHEYYPYGETWQKYGYWEKKDELLGTPTNINVSGIIKPEFYPFHE
jgi:murein tripeptide amidase MpaA